MILFWKRTVAVILMVTLIMTFCTGCWGNREIDSLFIITGIGIDTTDDPSKFDFTVQVGNASSTGEEGQSQSGSGTDQSSGLVMKIQSDTAMAALETLSCNSDRRLILHHNQVLVFGSELAKQGIKDQIDLFLRDHQARVEVPIVIAEGRAEDVMTAQLSQDPISGMFLSGMLDDLEKKNEKYRVRLIDFVSTILEKTTCPAIPIVEVVEKDEKQEINMAGLGIFKDGKMIGQLDTNEIWGYVFTMEKLNNCRIDVQEGSSQAGFYLSVLTCKRTITLPEENKVAVSLSVKTTLKLAELRGFEDLKPDDLIPHLQELVEKKIKNEIEKTYQIVQRLDADIYGYGMDIYRKYPKEWETLQKQWDQVFPNITFDITVKVKIPATGHIVPSLEMEEKENEN